MSEVFTCCSITVCSKRFGGGSFTIIPVITAGFQDALQYAWVFSVAFTLDTYTHITNDMQRGAVEKIGGFMETMTAKSEPEPPAPPE